MGGIDDLIMIPIAVIIMAVLDYAAWNIFVAVAGGFAVLYMAFLIILEVAALVKLAS